MTASGSTSVHEPKSRTVLMISPVFPPARAPGSNRLINFTRTLPDHGWNCAVIAMSEKCFPLLDHELLKRVHPATHVEYFRCGNPFEHLRTWATSGEGTSLRPLRSLARKVTTFVDLLSICDLRRWSLRNLRRAVAQGMNSRDVDAVWITGPTFSFFRIVPWLKRRYHVPVVLDMRDPWTLTPLRYRHLARFNGGIERKLERHIFGMVDRIITNTPTAQREYIKTYPELKGVFSDVITNGFSPDILESVAPERFDRTTIVHAGNTSTDRSAATIIRALGRLRERGVVDCDSFRFISYGPGHAGEHQAAQEAGVSDMVEFRGNRPHADVLAAIRGATALALIVAHGHHGSIPSKLFEYLGNAKPILFCGPLDCDAAEIVRQAGAGRTFEFDQVDGIAECIQEIVEGRFVVADTLAESARRFTAEAVGEQLAKVLDEVASKG